MNSVLGKLTTERIAALKPSFMSVTYGAGGGRSKYTTDIAKNIQDTYGVPVIAHLTCVSSTKKDVEEQIGRMKEAGIENVLALRGDIPKDIPKEDIPTDFRYAHELVSYIKDKGDFCIGGACYPEGHPECDHIMEDITHIREKTGQGMDFLTTQMFYDNNIFYNYMYKLRESGVDVPVIPGIMPLTRKSQLHTIKDLSGSFLPQRFIQMVDRFGDDKKSMQQAGIAYATDQVIDLFANGINHVHIYSMNDHTVAEKIMENVGDIIKAR